jgi:hypothetical protein
MNEPHDPNRTVDVLSAPAVNEPHAPGHTVDHPSAPADSLDAGLAAGFAAPRSSLGEMRPVLLKEAEGDIAFWRNEQAQAGRERNARNAEAVAALLNQ